MFPPWRWERSEPNWSIRRQVRKRKRVDRQKPSSKSFQFGSLEARNLPSADASAEGDWNCRWCNFAIAKLSSYEISHSERKISQTCPGRWLPSWHLGARGFLSTALGL